MFTKTNQTLKNVQKELAAFKKKQTKEIAKLVGYMEKSIHLLPVGEYNQPKLFEQIFNSIEYLNTAEE